ncbi:uncharacterized protein LOC131251223 isoform X2 [Magnolia sinica]|uniref:uncharacterized protein LOC131251223 isoform X2 n=1 Tax=Magnolia sinica TaxID=86752 RepID=UPI0026581A04|nr:uncharacterized protein LOC131251223 isoform X2 [Magnolia sinica]XP_058107809.1 uncharacterized protein LOC131251223 isoform X2 [Magnolia sinica]XP_058107810.1 uncharacterized protein LOC131251223 isoform X2 [Magnolia sinica]
MKDPSTAFDQISGHPLAPSLDLRHQQANQLAEYPHHLVRQDHQQYQEQSFEAPLHHGLRQNHSVPDSSHANSSLSVEPEKMSSGEGRRVSRQDIQMVQNFIEGCLQRYMNQKEVVEALSIHLKIEPGFTELVWQKLEEENREFFKAYHVRLMVKRQIMMFNKLLEKQAELMHKRCPTGVASLPISNGSHSLPLHQNLSYYAAGHTTIPSRLDHMNQPTDLSNVLINGGPSMHLNMHTADYASTHAGRMNIEPNMLLTQNSQMGMLQGMNGMEIKSEPDGYSNTSAFAFSVDNNVLDPHSTIRKDTPVASFSSAESNVQPLNEPFLDSDIEVFSLSDFSMDFMHSDIIGSPFLATHTDKFQDSPGRECQENKRLDTLSEGTSYEEYCGD